MFAKAFISTCFVTMATSAAAAAETRDLPQAEIFAETIWAYVEETCPDAVLLSDEINAKFQRSFGLPLDPFSGAFAREIEAIAKNVIAPELSPLDKRAIAMAHIGAFGVIDQIDFASVLDDQEKLAQPNYLEEEERLRARASASLQLMKCLSPTKDEVMNPPGEFRLWEVSGRKSWQEIASVNYTGLCKLGFFDWYQTLVDTDFASVQPQDRGEYLSALYEALEATFSPTHEADCEDLS